MSDAEVGDYALIGEDGIIFNVVIWDGVGDIFDDYNCIRLPKDSRIGIGWYWDGKEFSDPNALPPLTKQQQFENDVLGLQNLLDGEHAKVIRKFNLAQLSDDEQGVLAAKSEHKSLMEKFNSDVAALKKQYGIK